MREHANRLSPSLVRQLALASGVSGVDFQRAVFGRTALFRHVQSLLADHDFLAMPTLSRTAPPIDQDLFGPLPIGLQLIGRFDEDADLLRLAACFEAAQPLEAGQRRPAP